MFDFLPGWPAKLKPLTNSDPPTNGPELLGLPLPAVTRHTTVKGKGKLQISAPILQSSNSLTGFDVPGYSAPWQHAYVHPSTTRAGLSNVAWFRTPGDYALDDVRPFTGPSAVPSVVRLSSEPQPYHNTQSISAPSMSHSRESPSSSSPSSSPESPQVSRWSHMKLDTNPIFAQSKPSLQLDLNMQPSVCTDVYGHAYNYPLAKQLSPIPEQDYTSPSSLRSLSTLRIPGVSKRNTSSPSPLAHSPSNASIPSLRGSLNSEIARPSPRTDLDRDGTSHSTSLPFISRPLNRTVSQSSSHTQASTSSIIPPSIKVVPDKPTAPPLNLSPPIFSSSHPSQDGGSPIRSWRPAMVAMPTILGSSESAGQADEEYAGTEDLASLHPESFVTATDDNAPSGASQSSPGDIDLPGATQINPPHQAGMIPGSPQNFTEYQDIPITPVVGPLPPMDFGGSRPSASESFIGRRWEKDAIFGSGMVTFRTKHSWLSCTPAFWAFWLGFICPVLWFVGGWHFTHFGEQPPRLTFWEFYFNVTHWKDLFCCSRRKIWKSQAKGTGSKGKESSSSGREFQLPRWVAEKQSSDDGRLRLQDPKRSLRGILFGYPFISRPNQLSTNSQPEQWSQRATKRVVSILKKPNRLFDLFYGVKLREVRGRPETGRRIFDPWIQRCRYAFCYAVFLLCVGLCSTCAYLIIYNTRQLRR